MSPTLLLLIFGAYFLLLLIIAQITSKGASQENFFVGARRSSWLLVAFGMIGTSLSGVTFLSVPGQVGDIHFSYMQIVLGYLAGYAVIALVLLPLYYRLQLTSIYSYLNGRFGNISYKTGALFFLLSRTLGASLRVFLVVSVLQKFVLSFYGITFSETAIFILVLILIYTYRGGVRTIVYTDTIQTSCMLLALVLTIFYILKETGYSPAVMIHSIQQKNYSQIFFWKWQDKDFFLKQFLSGMFITIVMTGLDQEMMQKNISCHNLRDAQKNVFTFTGILLIVNLLFLTLGAMLYIFAAQKNIFIPKQTDNLLPVVALHYLSPIASFCFMIGLISALYPSADGALTALTTSFCIDILDLRERTNWDDKKRRRIRYFVHFSFALLLLCCVLIFNLVNDKAVISTLFTIASYTYGPLLGLYAFGLFTHRKITDAWSPLICLTAPVICYFLNDNSKVWFHGYQFGFELLLVNGLLTFAGLYLISKPKAATE